MRAEPLPSDADAERKATSGGGTAPPGPRRRLTEEEFLPTRSTLLSRLRDWADQESWRQFDASYTKLIYTTALSAGLQEADALDVVQETYLSVLREVAKFRYDRTRGKFKAWLLCIVRSRIADHWRRQQRRAGLAQAVRQAAEADPPEAFPDPLSVCLQEAWESEWEPNLADAAIAAVKERIAPLQYQVYYLRVLKGQPARQIADALSLSIARVYLIKHRVGRVVRAELRRLQTEVEQGRIPHVS